MMVRGALAAEIPRRPAAPLPYGSGQGFIGRDLSQDLDGQWCGTVLQIPFA
jgi:hypothetical protein